MQKPNGTDTNAAQQLRRKIEQAVDEFDRARIEWIEAGYDAPPNAQMRVDRAVNNAAWALIINVRPILAALDAVERLAEARAHIDALLSNDDDGYPYWYDSEFGECVYCRGGENMPKTANVTHTLACPVYQAQKWCASAKYQSVQYHGVGNLKPESPDEARCILCGAKCASFAGYL